MNSSYTEISGGKGGEGGSVEVCKAKNLRWGEYGYYLELHNGYFP